MRRRWRERVHTLVGCLLIHGFTGDTTEVEPLARHLKEQGAHTACPTLAGHGNHPSISMKDVTWRDWVASAEKGIQSLTAQCDTVHVIGFSMGGLIACYLANRYRVDKLVLLSTSVFYLNPKQLAKDLAAHMQSLLSDHGKSPLQEDYRRYRQRIKTTPLRAVAEFHQLVRALRPEIHKIKVPTLIIQGACDDIVDPRSAKYIYDHIQTPHKQLHILPKSKHIVCHGIERDRVIFLTDQFLLRSGENRHAN